MERDSREPRASGGARDAAAAKAYLQDLYDYFRMDTNMDPILLFEQVCCVLLGDVEEEEYQALEGYDQRRLGEWYQTRVSQYCADILDWDVPVDAFVRRPKLLLRLLAAARGVMASVGEGKAALGPLLAEFLETISQSRQGNIIYTPLETAREIVEFLHQERQTAMDASVLDPACGNGAFPIALMERAREENSGGVLRILGLEGDEHLRTSVALLAHFYACPGIDLKLEAGGSAPDMPENAYDLILANPPFRPQTHRDREWFGDTRGLPVETNDIHRAFIQRILMSLKPGGEGAVIVPESFLSSAGVDAIRVRRWIVEEFRQVCVVKLPAYTFYPRGVVSADILFFRKPDFLEGGAPEERYVFFFKVDVDGRSGDTRRQPVPRNDFDELRSAWSGREALWREWRGAQTARNAYGVGVPARWDRARCWFGGLEDVRRGDYSLLPEQYQPTQLLSEPVRDPAEILEELQGLGVEILSLTRRLTEAEYGR